MRLRFSSRAYVSAAVIGLGLAAVTTTVAQPLPARTAIVLAINDVYRIEGLNYEYSATTSGEQAGGMGGLARVRTLRDTLDGKQRELDRELREELERRLKSSTLDAASRTRHEKLREALVKGRARPAEGGVLLLHGGDFLFPSLLSRTYKGEQMVRVLNLLAWARTPGRSPSAREPAPSAGAREAPGPLDPHMIAVFGNHEFDEPACDPGGRQLRANIEDSRFMWLHSNIEFADCFRSTAAMEQRLARESLVTIGGIRIGVFGLTIAMAKPDYVWGFERAIRTARQASASLRQKGAEVVVALTHLDKAEDKAILDALREDGPDLVVGGHDHEAMAEPVEWTTTRTTAGGIVAKVERTERRHVYKADADARTASVITITVSDDGGITVHHEFAELTDRKAPADPEVHRDVVAWLEKHEKAFCQDLAAKDSGEDPAHCLTTPQGRIGGTALVGEESKIRGTETSLGNWVTDLMRTSCRADVAFVNSGALRLNQDLPVHGILRRRHIEELFAYAAPLRVVELTGAQLLAVASHGVKEWPGSGRWLQVSGFAFRHQHDAAQSDPARRDRATDLTLLTPAGPRPATEVTSIRAVTSAFLVGGGDGYTMLKMARDAGPCEVDGTDDFKKIVLRMFREGAKGESSMKTLTPPMPEGRICGQGTPCLAISDVARSSDGRIIAGGLLGVVMLTVGSCAVWIVIMRRQPS